MSRNQLDLETSPYLLQHKDNPVHWRPWGEQALAEAKQQDKPILLSVGYAACHWCHVMAHESFENPETARLMNELYIPIKVDREERPDIDALYQGALSLLGQQGGWPLTMFLTPDAQPFWGGTYFPPSPRYGRPSFRDVLTGVAETYRHQPDKVETNVSALMAGLARRSKSSPNVGMISLDLLDQAARSLLRYTDPVRGGLKGAPKFPQTPMFQFLWRAALRLDDPQLEQAVLTTLDGLCQGGIYDHLGGGFARYSTDEDWLVPHFEKMLYDNAQLVDLLVLAWQHSRKPLYRQRIEETITWLMGEMIAENGAFAATLDADSEGEEGKFYVWTEAEIEEFVPKKTLPLFRKVYDVVPGGNWEGRIILNRNGRQPTTDAAAEVDLAKARSLLLAARSERIRPGRDDKVLADWNAMMIAALAQAGFALQHPDWTEQAEKVFAHICRDLASPRDANRLIHCWCQGRGQDQAVIDDYAQMARAALILAEITGKSNYADQAQSWVKIADRHYWDEKSGGYFFTADDADDLILRSKTALDQATPNGNGVMAEVLARLYHLTGEDHYRQRTEETVSAFAGEFSESFANMATLLSGWDYLQTAVQIILVGAAHHPVYEQMRRVIANTCLPNRFLLRVDPGAVLPEQHPAFGKTQHAEDSLTAYVCVGQTCSLPITDPADLRHALSRHKVF